MLLHLLAIVLQRRRVAVREDGRASTPIIAPATAIASRCLSANGMFAAAAVAVFIVVVQTVLLLLLLFLLLMAKMELGGLMPWPWQFDGGSKLLLV